MKIRSNIALMVVQISRAASILHINNLDWTLQNGLYCANSDIKYPNWVSIGNPDLTEKRSTHPVPLSPGGYLSDYVPFYFTPFSVMMRNIHTGWGDITKRKNEEIVILVSSIPHLVGLKLPYVFTDSHAYYQWANFYNDSAHLDKIDWTLLQQRDFKRDAEDPAKFERYQAEALIYQYCPIEGLLGLVCYTPELQTEIEQQIQTNGLKLKVHARPLWYFQ